MKTKNRELQIFQQEHLLNKQEVLTSVKAYMVHCIESQEEGWSLAKRSTVIDLCKGFYRQVESMEDFTAEEDWQFFEYCLTGTGMQLERLLCTGIEITEDDEIESMNSTVLEMMAFTECNYLSVNEFAERYDVTDTTVRQWIRRGKIRHAKKNGRDWLISALTDYPKRGYESVTYLWKETLKGEEFRELTGYHQLFIYQDEYDKKRFIGVLGRFEEKELKFLEMNVQEREKLELALISRDDVEVIEIEDGIMFSSSKCEEGLDEEIDEEDYISLPYGPVVVTKGKHKGRIGYLDDEEGAYGFIYWGDMLLSLDHCARIPLSYLSSEISTNQILRRNYALKNEIARIRARSNPNYALTTQLLTELLFIEQMLTKRYYEVAFLKPQYAIKIFLCYAQEDSCFAKTLATDLTEKGYEVFLADWSIEIGDSILTEIEKGLETASVLVPVISKDFLASDFCKNQWQAFYHGNKEKDRPIIPIIIDESEIPRMLSDYKYFRLGEWESSYEEVLLALLKKLKKEADAE